MRESRVESSQYSENEVVGYIKEGKSERKGRNISSGNTFQFCFVFSLCKWKVKIKGKILLWNKKSSVENLCHTVMYPLLERLVTSGSSLCFSK